MPITSSTRNNFPIPGATETDSRLLDIQATKAALTAVDEKLYDLEQTAAIPGPQGPAGADGVAGAVGPAGPAGADGVAASFYISASFPGAIGPLDSKARWAPPREITFTNITFNIDTAADIADVVLDIKKNGVTMFPTVKPTLAIGAARADIVITGTVLPTDYITLDIVSGSGADMTVRLDYI